MVSGGIAVQHEPKNGRDLGGGGRVKRGEENMAGYGFSTYDVAERIIIDIKSSLCFCLHRSSLFRQNDQRHDNHHTARR